MSWNYRVVKRTLDNEVCYSIEEAYYNDLNQVTGWTESNEIIGDDLSELQQVLQHMQESLNKEVINES